MFPDVEQWLAYTTALAVGAEDPNLSSDIEVLTPDGPSVILADERKHEESR